MSEEIERHILQEYSVVKKMGNGAYGHVWRVIEKSSKRSLALKKIFDAFQHSTDAQRTYRQIRILHDLKHENIVTLERVIRSKNDKDLYLLFTVMEADLHSAIVDNILEEVHYKYIIAQTLRALKYIHSAQLVHRDLKPSNILLNSDCLVKVCDFGLVRSVAREDSSDPVMTEDVATRWYRAPEVLLGSKSYGVAADVWSLGCILGEMLRGKPMFNGSNTIDQIQKIMSFTGKPNDEEIGSMDSEMAAHIVDSIKTCKQKPLRQWFPKASEEAIHLVTCLLQFNPKKRLTVEQALRHAFLSRFISPKEEVSCPRVIKPDVSDNMKLTVRDYKHLIYQWVKQHYKEPEIFQQREAKASLYFKQQKRVRKSESLKNDKPYTAVPQPSNQSLQKSFTGMLRREASSMYQTAGGLGHSSSGKKLNPGMRVQERGYGGRSVTASDLLKKFQSRIPHSRSGIGLYSASKSKLK